MAEGHHCASPRCLLLDHGAHSITYDRSGTQSPLLTILPNESKAQLVLMTGRVLSLLAKAPEEVFWHVLDG